MSEHQAASGQLASCHLARSNPILFHAAVEEYGAIVQLAVEETVSGNDRRAFGRVRTLARKAARDNAVPQDLIAVHLTALAMVIRNRPHAMAKACVRHSRLLLVKMIGELALYYREQARGEKAAVL
jgi:hypothetical protein